MPQHKPITDNSTKTCKTMNFHSFLPNSRFQRELNWPWMDSKVECVFPMVVVSIFPHAEFGWNDRRKDALLFSCIKKLHKITDNNFYAEYDIICIIFNFEAFSKWCGRDEFKLMRSQVYSIFLKSLLRFELKWRNKVGCVFLVVVVSILPHAEDASHFIINRKYIMKIKYF